MTCVQRDLQILQGSEVRRETTKHPQKKTITATTNTRTTKKIKPKRKLTESKDDEFARELERELEIEQENDALATAIENALTTTSDETPVPVLKQKIPNKSILTRLVVGDPSRRTLVKPTTKPSSVTSHTGQYVSNIPHAKPAQTMSKPVPITVPRTKRPVSVVHNPTLQSIPIAPHARATTSKVNVQKPASIAPVAPDVVQRAPTQKQVFVPHTERTASTTPNGIVSSIENPVLPLHVPHHETEKKIDQQKDSTHVSYVQPLSTTQTPIQKGMVVQFHFQQSLPTSIPIPNGVNLLNDRPLPAERNFYVFDKKAQAWKHISSIDLTNIPIFYTNGNHSMVLMRWNKEQIFMVHLNGLILSLRTGRPLFMLVVKNMLLHQLS